MKQKKNLNILQNQPIPKKRKAAKYCRFCKFNINYVDYKDVDTLKKFLNPQGKILRPLYTGNCRKHQKTVAVAIKTARELSLIPYIVDNYE